MPRTPKSRGVTIALWCAYGFVLAVILVFGGLRVSADAPHLVGGTEPSPDSFEARYVAHPWLAALHIVPGFIFLIAAIFQLSQRFRTRHWTTHRRLGRVAWGAGLTSGVFALAFGIPLAWGGAGEASATVAFGAYFLASLVLAFRAIRRRDTVAHRRWMIRAVAVGLGVGSIRMWIGMLLGLGLLEDKQAFAAAFWIALSMHALAAELYLRWRPAPDARTAARERAPTAPPA